MAVSKQAVAGQESVAARVQRCGVPLLWLDTAVLIKMGKLNLGLDVPEPDRARVRALLDVILRKARAKRLACPEGEQDDEFEVGQGDVAAARRAMIDSSRTIRLQHRLTIERFQFHRLAQAYLAGNVKVDLPYMDAFHHDPEKVLAAEGQVLISVHFPPRAEDIEQRKAVRASVHAQQDSLRVANLAAGVTFEQQRDREYEALVQQAHELSRRAAEGLSVGDPMASFAFASSPLMLLQHSWQSLGGTRVDFWDFVKSSHYKAIPTVDISANLYADVLTGGKMDDGDAMDISHLSSALPYCNFVLTDRAMRNRLKRLGIDAKYGVEVFALQDTAALVSRLEQL